MDVLIVEIGNTVTDFAVFNDEHCLAASTALTAELSDRNKVQEQTTAILDHHPAVIHAAVCSVVPAVGTLFLQGLGNALPGRVLEINSSLNLPFTLDYKPPDALGADRLALCAYSSRKWPDKAVVSVDIGTAITFDVLSSRGVYLGGMILPGLDLMTAGLHQGTAKLPAVQITESSLPLLGKSTEECMQSGVFWGCVKQVEGLIAAIRRFLTWELQEEEVKVVGTGGSCTLVASALHDPPEINAQAVMKGAKVLLDINM